MEDFARDGKVLDDWTFEHATEFLSAAFTNSSLREQLSRAGNVFFLHLLGLDTNGHAFRPHAAPYPKKI